MTEITTKDIEELLSYFEKNTYRVKESNATSEKILSKCIDLWQEDYACIIVPNIGGELCNSYPNRLIIPECENSPEGLKPPDLCPLSLTTSSPLSVTSPSPLSLTPQSVLPPLAPSFSSVVAGKSSGGGSAYASTLTLNGDTTTNNDNRKGSLPGDKSGVDNGEAQTEGSRLRELILKAKVARCRARFPVPAILYKGNYISRLLYRNLSGCQEKKHDLNGIGVGEGGISIGEEGEGDSVGGGGSDWTDRVNVHEIRLRKAFQCIVSLIIYLKFIKKKIKFGIF
ncbi:unnamed protein product, partial [Meganyctiphanes norvegica]